MSGDPPAQPAAPEDEDLYCLACGYNLRGLPGMTRTCPECGRSNELDESRVGLNVVVRMHRRIGRRLNFVSSMAAGGGVGIAVGLAVQPGAGAAAFMAFGLIWSFSLAMLTPSGMTHESALVLSKWTVAHSAWIAITCAASLPQPFIAWMLRGRFGLWFGMEWRDPCVTIWTVLTIGVIFLISRRLYRWHMPKLLAALKDHAETVAQRWHYDRLRQPHRR